MNPDIQKKLDEAIREYDALEMGIAESFKWPREKIARFGELSKLKVMADEYEKVDDNRKKDTNIAHNDNFSFHVFYFKFIFSLKLL